MNLADKLNRILEIMRAQKAVIGEGPLKKSFDALQDAADDLLEQYREFEGVDWPLLLELRAALKAATPKKVSEKLSRFGFRLASAKQKDSLAVAIVKSGKGGEVLNELKKTPEAEVSEEFYRYVEMPRRQAESALRAMSDKELEAFVKKHKGKVSKRTEQKKKRLEVDKTIFAFLEKLDTERLRTGP